MPEYVILTMNDQNLLSKSNYKVIFFKVLNFTQ